MSLHTLFETIESLEFTAEFAVISGTNALNFALNSDATIEELVSILRQYPQYGEKVNEHLHELLQAQSEPPYLHPNDIPIAVYLHALNEVNKAVARTLADTVLATPRMRWSREVAKRIKSEPYSFVDTQGNLAQYVVSANISGTRSEDVMYSLSAKYATLQGKVIAAESSRVEKSKTVDVQVA